jgi:cell division septation protein DedD
MRTSVDTSTARWYARALDGVLSPDPSATERLQTAEDAATETGNPIPLEDVTSPRAQSNLARLADHLGIEPATLLAKVAAGEDVRSLLSGARDAGYGALIVQPGTGGIAIDQYA